jgi:hypothetical protein
MSASSFMSDRGIKFALTCESKNSIIIRSFSGAVLTAPISITERESK